MADANARKQAIEQASQQVRTGSAFVRRAQPTAAPTPVKSIPAVKKER
jgi:hypothetical protein